MTHGELASRFGAHGFAETEASVTNQLAPATMSAHFDLASLAAIGREGVRQEEIQELRHQADEMAREENGKPEQGGGDKISPTVGGVDSSDRGETAQQRASIREQAFVDRITKSDRWMIWLTAAIVFTGVVSAYFSKGQWSVMQAQLDEMRDEQRPWIGAPTSVVGEIGPDGTYGLSIEMENSGKLPTNSLGVDERVVHGDEFQWIAASKRICRDLAAEPIGNTLSLIPNSKWLIPSDLVPSGLKNLKVADLRAMENPFLAGCVAYTFDGGDAIHHTAFGAHLKIDGERVVGDRIYAADAN